MERRRSALAVVAVLVGALALGLGVTAAVREGVVATAWWRSARFAYDHDLHGPARFLFMQFALHHPDDERALMAVNLMLDDYNLTEDWKGLFASRRRVLDDPRLGPRVRQEESERFR